MAKQTALAGDFFLFIGLASIGLPGTNGFVGEFLILLGDIQSPLVVCCHGGDRGDFRRGLFSLVLRTVDVWTGRKAVQGSIGDLHAREMVIALSLSVMILWIGIYPAPFLSMMNGSVQALVDRLESMGPWQLSQSSHERDAEVQGELR